MNLDEKHKKRVNQKDSFSIITVLVLFVNITGRKCSDGKVTFKLVSPLLVNFGEV